MTLPQQDRQWIGDLTIRFGAPVASIPSRVDVAGWTSLASDRGWEALAGDVNPQWRGYPVRTQSEGGWRTWLLGELYGSADPDHLVRDVVSGEVPAEQLNGHFLLFGWHAESRRWHVWTDRFGTLHAYHTQSQKGAAIGTFFPAVADAASSRRLDWEALSGFFSFGFFPQDRTFFDDVRILRPATHSVFDERGALLSSERYWQWRHEPTRSRTYDETVEEFAGLFDEVMQDHLRTGAIAVPISGGLDSRTTVAALDGRRTETADRLWAYSYGYSADSVETRIAQQVACQRNLPFAPFVTPPYLFDRLDTVLASVEGFQDVTQCRQAAVLEHIRCHADHVIAAHWGDVWLDDMGLAANAATGASDEVVADHALRKMAKRGRAWLVDNLCDTAGRVTDAAEIVRSDVQQEAAKLSHIEDPDFRVKALKTDNWSFRWTMTSLRMFQPAAFPRVPFYDTRLTDLFCTIPTAYVAGRQLQIDYLKRHAPDLAKVKWQVYDANLYAYHRFSSWHLPKRAAKKVWRAMSGAKVTERNWEVQFMNAEGREGLKRCLTRPGLKLHDLAPAAKVSELVDAFYGNPLTDGRAYTVCMLLTFSSWLERYA